MGSIEEALAVADSRDQVVVLERHRKSEIHRALHATNSAGLPRWAVLVLGTEDADDGLEAVPAGKVDERFLGYAVKSAIARHRLRCDVLRAEGDLRTIASRISHDLRTPLGGILMMGEVLKDTFGNAEPSPSPWLGKIVESVDDMERLIERVSFVVRASANPATRIEVDVGEACVAAHQRLERQFLDRKVSFVVPKSWPTVPAVSSWVETVWWNLLVNGLQHGGTVSRIEVGCDKDAGGFRFWVQDNGDGVETARRRHLFEPFHLLHRRNSGRGLGLSIVRRLVELMGGRCGFEAPAAGGSCFHFTLPAAAAAGDRDGDPVKLLPQETAAAQPA
jgi:signal transduction histidine kinase